MTAERVKTPEDAIAYMTDCTLATVVRLAMKKSRAKHEFERQVSIAQKGVDWMREFTCEINKQSRAFKVIEAGSVSAWAEQFKPENKQ